MLGTKAVTCHKQQLQWAACVLILLPNPLVGWCRDAMRQAVSYLGPQLPQQAALLGALSRWVQVRCSDIDLLMS